MSKVYRKSFFSMMVKTKLSIAEKRDRDAGKAFLKVEKFVKECSYSTYKEAQRFVNMRLSGYSYDRVAKNLGVTEETVRWRDTEVLSKKLYSLFGDDFFSLLNEYSVHKSEVDKRIFLVNMSDKRVNDYVLSDISTLINGEMIGKLSLSDVNLSSCNKEIAFLSRHSLSTIKRELADLSIEKLAYLLDILEGYSGTLEEKYYLLGVLGEEEVNL